MSSLYFKIGLVQGRFPNRSSSIWPDIRDVSMLLLVILLVTAIVAV